MSNGDQGCHGSQGDLSNQASIVLDSTLYSDEVALKAAYGLADRCHVHIARDEGGRLVAHLRLKHSDTALTLTTACGEFCNALIDHALRARIASETRQLQERLLERAFAGVLPAAVEIKKCQG